MSQPKFKTGQVACIKKGWMNAGYYGLIWHVRKGKDAPEYWFRDGRIVSEVALRPLTRRERGGV